MAEEDALAHMEDCEPIVITFIIAANPAILPPVEFDAHIQYINVRNGHACRRAQRNLVGLDLCSRAPGGEFIARADM